MARVIRAGYANTAWLIIPTIVTLLELAAREAPLSAVWRYVAGFTVGAMLVCVYARAISRLSISDGVLRLTRALDSVTAPILEIERVRLASIPSSMLVMIMLSRRGRAIPDLFYYISPLTNWGNVPQTLAQLRRVLGARGVRVQG